MYCRIHGSAFENLNKGHELIVRGIPCVSNDITDDVIAYPKCSVTDCSEIG